MSLAVFAKENITIYYGHKTNPSAAKAIFLISILSCFPVKILKHFYCQMNLPEMPNNVDIKIQK